MNPKINKLSVEIEKHKKRIADWQARLRDMEQQKTELENAEIIAAVRGIRSTPEELESLLVTLRDNQPPDFSQNEQEGKEATKNPAFPKQAQQEDNENEK